MTRSPGADSLFPFPEDGPDFRFERSAIARGARHVAGVDEAGRGPLAGPVVAAAVVLDPGKMPMGLDDSKKLSRIRREQAFAKIVCFAEVAWAAVPATGIDRSDIRKASLEAMRRAVCALPVEVDHVLVDGRDTPPGLPCSSEAIIKGDARSLSIAAASIVAKVVRDAMMTRCDGVWPHYGFARHAGYGVEVHRIAISQHGPCALHRLTFSPIRN